MPANEEDVSKILKQLQKILAGKKEMDSALDLISGLKEMDMTLQVLTNTRIGMVLNELRKKTSDEKIAKQAKSLIKKWKTLIEDKASAQTQSQESNGIQEPDQDQAQESPTQSQSSQSNESNSISSTSVITQRINGEANETREKTVQLLATALCAGELPAGSREPETLAIQIEEQLFDRYNGTGEKYRAAVRSRLFNLRDKKNPVLRENVLLGYIEPGNFALMKADEMASEEMKSLRDRFNKESILDHQMSVQEGTESDMFRCGKCGKSNCTYNQMQTRSADEPMTTFVYCRTCGNRWKFC